MFTDNYKDIEILTKSYGLKLECYHDVMTTILIFVVLKIVEKNEF